jgi:hypothetical protein
MKPSTACIILGILFLGVGILGFISNPLVGESENVIFHADTTHNIVHIASGALFLLFGMAMPHSAAAFMMVFGLVYLFLGVLGLINIGTTGMGTLLGFLHVNGADNLLHIGLGLLIILLSIMHKKARPAPNP